jgi:hypothetical protein
MALFSSELELEDIRKFGGMRQMKAAHELASAAKDAFLLDQRMPDAVESYGHGLMRAVRGITERTKKETGANRQFYLVRLGNSAIGEARIVPRTPDSIHFPIKPSVELAFWHASQGNSRNDVQLGKQIVEDLISRTPTLQDGGLVSDAWALTAPLDGVREDVFSEAGFVAAADPIHVTFPGAAVSQERTLWMRSLNA